MPELKQSPCFWNLLRLPILLLPREKEELSACGALPIVDLDLSCSSGKGGVISDFVISYISWDLITPVIRLITFRADIIPARALGKLLYGPGPLGESGAEFRQVQRRRREQVCH